MSLVVSLCGHFGRPSVLHTLRDAGARLICGPPPREREIVEEHKPDSKCRCTKCVRRTLTEDEKAAQEAFQLPSFVTEITRACDAPDKGGPPPQTIDDFYMLTLGELGYVLLFGATNPVPRLECLLSHAESACYHTPRVHAITRRGCMLSHA